jgi:CBS domain-containing protein
MPNRQISKVIGQRPFPTVAKSTIIRDVAIIMKEWRSSAVLVMESGTLIGICTERDIAFRAIALDCNTTTTSVESIMTSEVQTIHKDKPFGQALHLMSEGGFRHIPVVDDAGRPVGVLTSEDALDIDYPQPGQKLLRREVVSATR